MPRPSALAQELGVIAPAAPVVADLTPARPAVADPLGQPRVLILPPETMLSEPLLQRVGRALLEDVTIGLSQQRGFKVIAAHTSVEILNRSLATRRPSADAAGVALRLHRLCDHSWPRG
jgi:TolB-like protein